MKSMIIIAGLLVVVLVLIVIFVFLGAILFFRPDLESSNTEILINPLKKSNSIEFVTFTSLFNSGLHTCLSVSIHDKDMIDDLRDTKTLECYNGKLKISSVDGKVINVIPFSFNLKMKQASEKKERHSLFYIRFWGWKSYDYEEVVLKKNAIYKIELDFDAPPPARLFLLVRYQNHADFFNRIPEILAKLKTTVRQSDE